MSELFQIAIQKHRRGNLREAERLYWRVLAEQPDHTDAMFVLSGLALEAGQDQAAVELLERAVELSPENGLYFSNLGEAYRRLGRDSEALSALIRSVSLQPRLAAPVFNLGLLFEKLGRQKSALTCFEKAVELRPDETVFHEKTRTYQRPTGFCIGSANGLPTGGDTEETDLLEQLGADLLVQGEAEGAAHWFRSALAINPGSISAQFGLGKALGLASRYDEAIACFREVSRRAPDNARAFHSMADMLIETGLVREAIACLRRAVELDPNNPGRQSAVVYYLPFDPDATARDIAEEARAWGHRYASAWSSMPPMHHNDRSPHRRLRVGYVSPDFRRHVNSHFTLPLFRHHHRDGFEIFCYSNSAHTDDVTAQTRALVDHWRDIGSLDDDAAAHQIRSDQVDVLVDLAMHTGQSRLLVFARKPAPVQACWLAYAGTTGIEAMDYRVSDVFLDPPGSHDADYTERTIRLPETFWCYDPLATTAVNGLPALEADHFTFGCFNRFRKMSQPVLSLWARVLRAVPGSRIRLAAPLGSARERLQRTFQREGIGPGRAEFFDSCPREHYLFAYHGIDCCLDTVPCNGGTTSLDAFWMGVPVLTLLGNTVAGRAGNSIARNLGLPELVANSPEEYVERAVWLASDLTRLSELRRSLRSRMGQSPLMDGERFASNLEAAYREIWSHWCASSA